MSIVQEAQRLDERLLSLDAYRGLIMVTLAFGGFGLAETAQRHLTLTPGSSFWETVRYQFNHTQWVGCSYWDLIQPSFMFMVGVSMAYSYTKRSSLGHSYARMLSHAITRSVLLVALSILFMSNRSDRTSWTFINVLGQIGLGYTFLFLLWRRSLRAQAICAAVILVGTWCAFVLYPSSGLDTTVGAPELGVTSDWAQENLASVRASWHKNANVGHAVDRWFLNLFPREKPFVFNQGGYQTLNFIPSIATMLFGLMIGELLRSPRSTKYKLGALLIAGVVGLLVGQVIGWTGVCPLVKRIWTPSWALYSTGWCCMILAGLFLVLDVLRCRFWAFPLVVVGMNSIAIYSMGMLLKGWTRRTLTTHLGKDFFQLAGEAWVPTVQAISVGSCFWLVCYWMYRRNIFLRL